VVTAGQELFLVTDLSRIWMIALVPEQYLGRLRTGMNVQVTSQLHPGRGFPGRITKLGEELDPETRTLQVRIELPNPGEALKPESYATAEIPLEGAKPAIRVPRGTVQDVHGGPVVFLQTGERRYEARPVQLGRTVDGRVEITQGLAPGDRVAVRGAFLLKSLLLRSSLAED
jgi:RND family efflux transporter MFP subunit